MFGSCWLILFGQPSVTQSKVLPSAYEAGKASPARAWALMIWMTSVRQLLSRIGTPSHPESKKPPWIFAERDLLLPTAYLSRSIHAILASCILFASNHYWL